MKRVKLILMSLVLLLVPMLVMAEEKEKATIYLFYKTGCQYCEGFMTWYDGLSEDVTSKFNLVKYEVSSNSNNSKALASVAEHFSVDEYGVPFIVIGSTYYNGFLESTMADTVLEAMNNYYDSDTREDLISELSLTVKADPTPSEQATKTAVVIVIVLIVVAGAGALIYAVCKSEG